MHQKLIIILWIFIIFLFTKKCYCAMDMKPLDTLIIDSELDIINSAYQNTIQKFNVKHLIVKRTLEEPNIQEDSVNYTEVNKTGANKKNETECIGVQDYCNMTKEDYIYMLNEYIYPQPYEWVLIGTHSLVFVVGLIGNALVCVAVYRNHSMRTVTNYFIVNLAVADFMVILFCLPPTVLWDVTETWFLGRTLCKILLYFQSVSVTVSVLTLTFISVDRWYAICFPLEFKSTTGRAKTAILVIWFISLLFNTPELVVLTVVRTVPLRFELVHLLQCMATWSDASDLSWHIVKVLFLYTIPLLLMTVAYYQIVRVLWRSDHIPGLAESIKLACAEQSQLRSRRKAAKMLVAVVMMFAICYFPVHLLSVLRYTDMEQTDVTTFLALLSHVMCYANSAINPLIYNFMSGKFHREYRRSFCCAPAGQPEHVTTLTRVTTSKSRRTGSQTLTLPTLTYCRSKFHREYRRSFCCAPAGLPEHVTTLTRVTTSKSRRTGSQTLTLPTLTYCRSTRYCSNVCNTTFIESKNSLLS